MVAAGIQKLCGLMGGLGKEGVGGEGQTGPPPALQPEKPLRITSQQEEEQPARSPESRTMWAPHQPENCKAATGFNKGGHCVCVDFSDGERENARLRSTFRRQASAKTQKKTESTSPQTLNEQC